MSLPIFKCWRLPNDQMWGVGLYRRSTGLPWLMFARDGEKAAFRCGPLYWLKGHGWEREKREGEAQMTDHPAKSDLPSPAVVRASSLMRCKSRLGSPLVEPIELLPAPSTATLELLDSARRDLFAAYFGSVARSP